MRSRNSKVRGSTFTQPVRKLSLKPFQLSDPSEFQELVLILQKASAARSEFEVLRLKKTFFELFPFFQKLMVEASEATIATLVQDMSYEFQPRRKPLFHIGDSGTKFYLILKGSVYVLAREKGLEVTETKKPVESERRIAIMKLRSGATIEDEVLVNNLQAASPLARQQSIKYDKLIGKVHSITKAKLSIMREELTDEELMTLKYPDLYIDRVIGYGEAFGELALRHADAKRMATIVCKEDCHFGVISKNIFQRALDAHFNRVMNSNLMFFRKHPLFCEWEDAQMEQFYQHVGEKKWVKNQIIYEEGETADFFYLIKEGEVEISKKVRQKRETNDKNQEFKSLISKIAAMKEKKKELRLRVSILENGEIFGLEELIANRKRGYQALCVSGSAILYCIAREKFLAYANDFKTLSKVLEMKKNVDSFRSKFVDTTSNFIVHNPIFEYNSGKILSPITKPDFFHKTSHNNTIDISREKFDGKLHCLDVKLEAGGRKSTQLIQRIEENRSFLEKNPMFVELMVKKQEKPIYKNGSMSQRSYNESYERFLNETREIYLERSKSKEKIKECEKSFSSKHRLSFVNLLDISQEKCKTSRKEQKLEKNAPKKIRQKISEFSENEHYFTQLPRISNKKERVSNLSLSGISIQSPFLLKL